MLEKLWRLYRAIAAAHIYIIGFELDGQVYMITRRQVGQFLTCEKASRGAGQAIRLRLRKADRVRLATKAICLGSASQLKATGYNRGENFERLVFSFYGLPWEKDTTPFTKCGDIQVDGVEIQIKFNGATFASEKTLARQLKLIREG